MDCKPTNYPSPGIPIQVRNRQMAALYLHEAMSARDASKQENLRRRAAQLIFPRSVDQLRRLAC